MSQIQKQYEQSWRDRLTKSPDEVFEAYERNGVLPPLFNTGESVLDLASGNSIVGQYLAKHYNCQVTAIDFSSSAIADAKKRGIQGVVGSVEEKLPFKSKSFDLVFWGDNIEHVFHPELVLKEIHRVLKPHGRLILSTPNQAYWRYRLHTLATGNLPKTEGDDNPPWQWEHIRFFTKPIIDTLLTQSGFTMTKFLGVSRRKPDRFILPHFPALFGMIMVVEATKTP